MLCEVLVYAVPLGKAVVQAGEFYGPNMVVQTKSWVAVGVVGVYGNGYAWQSRGTGTRLPPRIVVDTDSSIVTL